MQVASLATSRKWPFLFYAGVPALITGFLWATSAYRLSLWQLGAAFSLCWIPWASYQHWRQQMKAGVPLFTLIAGMYWLGYAVPLFWGEHSIGLVTGYHRLSEDSLTASLCLAVAGLVCLGAGMKTAEKWRWVPRTRLDIPENPWRWHYLRVVLVAATLMKVLVPVDALGEDNRQVLSSIESIIPGVVFVILFRSYLRGRTLGVDKLLLIGYFVVTLVTGLSSGWLGTFVGLGITCIAAYMLERRHLPVAAMLVVLPVILFLQPGKAKFRAKYWHGGPSEGYSESYGERVGFWIDASAQAWGRALSDPSGEGVRALSSATLSRLSLLQPTANVIETTPSRVPYQAGRLYAYFLVTFVPRFLWPDKPSVSDANKWYQVAYNLTRLQDIGSVGLSVGSVTESYINFGWFGPPMVIFCLGLLLGLFEKILLEVKCGLLFGSIGVALLPGLLSIESQMAVYIAGLVQQIFFAVIILIPVLQLRSNKDRSLGREGLACTTARNAVSPEAR